MAGKFHPLRRLRRLWQSLYGQAAGAAERFGQQTDEVIEQAEPIDFSSPSIPYYQTLANRIAFVRVILYMVLLVFVVTTVVSNSSLITYSNLYYLVKDIGAASLTAQSEAEHLSYPLSPTSSDFALFRGGLVVAGGSEVTAISGSGKQTMSQNVSYAAPAVRASDKFYLTFGRGENSFAVYNSFVRVYSEDTEYPVFDACVGDNGYFAVVTRSRDYASEVILYNDRMEKIANYHLGSYVTDVALNKDGDVLAITSITSEDGRWLSKIHLVRIEKRITSEVVEISGAFASLCGFISGDRAAVVMDDRLLILRPDGTINAEILFSDGEATLCAISDGRAAILQQGDSHLSEQILTVYDRSGKQVYRLTVNANSAVNPLEGATAMTFGGNVLFIRTRNGVWRIAANGSSATFAEVGRDATDILAYDGDSLLICFPAYARRVSAEDFTTP